MPSVDVMGPGSRAWAPAREGHDDGRVRRAATLARWLDDRYLDPVIGFIFPGGGDVITAGAGLYIVLVALKERLPAVVIARMLLNLAIDTLLGAIPFVGDVFDLVLKANRRNARLLVERAGGGVSRPADWAWVIGAAILLVAALGLPVLVLVLLVRSVF